MPFDSNSKHYKKKYGNERMIKGKSNKILVIIPFFLFLNYTPTYLPEDS